MDAPTQHSTARPFLLLAGWGTLSVAAAQALMPFSRELVRAFDGPDQWSTPLLFASSFGVAAILALLAAYPLSGAGVVRRLPLLLPVLALAGAGFLLRGLSLPLQVAGALGHGPLTGEVAWGDIVSSAVTFDLGVAYLVGFVLLWRAAPSASARRLVSRP